MKYLLLIVALASTSVFANRPPASYYAAASAPETFEQMCTRRASVYGTVTKKTRLDDKPDGYTLELTENGRKKAAECFVNTRGILTFTVKDVKKNGK